MKTIVVTGTSKGIGFCIVQHLLNANCKVIGISRSKTNIEHKYFTGIEFDLVNGDITELATQLREITGSVDGLVNNAGSIVNKPFVDITYNELLSVYQTNVFAPFQLVQSLVPMFNEGAHILNLSSMGGFQGASKFPGLSAYSSSKSAITGLTECLAEELKENNIKVNAIALGAVQTEMLESAFPGYQAPISATDMGEYLANFVLTGHKIYNGKILPAALSTP